MTKQEFLQGKEFRLSSTWYRFNGLGHDDPARGAIEQMIEPGTWVYSGNVDLVTHAAVKVFTFWLGKHVRVTLKFAELPTDLPKKTLNHNSAA